MAVLPFLVVALVGVLVGRFAGVGPGLVAALATAAALALLQSFLDRRARRSSPPYQRGK